MNKAELLREIERFKLAKMQARPPEATQAIAAQLKNKGYTDEQVAEALDRWYAEDERKFYLNSLLAHRVGRFCSMEFFEYLDEQSKNIGDDFSDEDPKMENFSLTAHNFREISDYLSASKNRGSLFKRILDAFTSESATIQRVLIRDPLHDRCIAYAKTLRAFERSLPEFWRDFLPIEFEKEVSRVFREIGYLANQTGQPGDGGVDINVCGKDGRKIAVQCKHHNRPIGPAPIRELIGAIILHGADLGIIVSTSGFTEKAYETALQSQNQILLLDLEGLVQLRTCPGSFQF